LHGIRAHRPTYLLSILSNRFGGDHRLKAAYPLRLSILSSRFDCRSVVSEADVYLSILSSRFLSVTR